MSNQLGRSKERAWQAQSAGRKGGHAQSAGRGVSDSRRLRHFRPPLPTTYSPTPPLLPPSGPEAPHLVLAVLPSPLLIHPPPLPPSCGPPLPSTDTQLEYPVSHPSQVLRPAIPPHLVLAVLPSRDDHVVDRAPVNLEHNNKRHSNEKGSVSVGCRRERQH